MAHYLLVHGAWHNESCWYLLKPILEVRGHSVTTLTLPGHSPGDERKFLRGSMSEYADHVRDVARDLHEPVICVAHSMSGYVLALAAEREPQLFSRLIYLTAFVPNGMRELMTLIWYHWKTGRKVWKTKFNLFWETTNTLKREEAREWMYHDCEPAIQEKALDALVPQRIAPFFSQVQPTQAKFGEVPKSYIECRNDRMIPPALQRRMKYLWHFDKHTSLPSSHSPFLSMPEKTADAIEEVSS